MDKLTKSTGRTLWENPTKSKLNQVLHFCFVHHQVVLFTFTTQIIIRWETEKQKEYEIVNESF